MRKIAFIVLFFCAVSVYAQTVADFIADRFVPYEKEHDVRTVAVAYAALVESIMNNFGLRPFDRIPDRLRQPIRNGLNDEQIRPLLKLVEEARKQNEQDHYTTLRVLGVMMGFDLESLGLAYIYYLTRRS